jgi:hypothetical protein
MTREEWLENVNNLSRVLNASIQQINYEFENMKGRGDESYYDYLWDQKIRLNNARRFVSALANIKDIPSD